MSFLKISDPLKRDSIVKEYLELKKNIRDNFLSERIGEQQLQTDLSKFYRPITETQKATAREITEGLKPIREGIEKLPEAIQPIGKATEEEDEEDEEEEEEEEEDEEEEEEEEEEEDEEEEEEDESVGELARHFLSKPDTDKIFGVRKEKGHHYIGNQHVIIKDDNIILSKDGDTFIGTPGLWGLITSKDPNGDYIDWTKKDRYNYGRLMLKTNALRKYYDPNNKHPRSSGGDKWNNILTTIWYGKEPKEGYEGKGVVVIPSDPNALLERLDLLLTSQEAGHTGVRNELVSICDELKRQGVLDTKAYKKLNSNIKK